MEVRLSEVDPFEHFNAELPDYQQEAEAILEDYKNRYPSRFKENKALASFQLFLLRNMLKDQKNKQPLPDCYKDYYIKVILNIIERDPAFESRYDFSNR